MAQIKQSVGAMFQVAKTLGDTSFVDADRQFDNLFRSQDVRKTFGSNITVLRGIRRMAVSKLASIVGRDHTHLSRVEREKSNISFSLAVAISQALGVSLKTMLTKDLQKACELTISQANASDK